MKAWLMQHAFNLVAGPIIGVVVYFAYEYLQKAIRWLDNQKAWVKRGIAIALSAVLTPVATALGASLPEICTALTEDTVVLCLTAIADKQWLTVAVGGGFALVTHRVIKAIKSR